jgi:hypothetical protein
MEKKLHVFSQHQSHDDAWIVGDLAALTALRDAIQRVIDGKQASGAKAFCEDGEGYTTIVLCVEDPKIWENMALPYTDVEGIPQETNVFPFHVIDVDLYRRIVRSGRDGHEQL